MGIILPHLGHNISTKPPLFALGKPKRKPRKTQKKSKEISVILELFQYADDHNSSVYLFYLTREFSVVFP